MRNISRLKNHGKDSQAKTAALIIIGDEILTGKVKDENSFVFTKLMFDNGVRVERIETIRDNIEAIADSIKYLSSSYDYVCTSGGVGPTHDDITFEGVAKAFDRPLLEHKQAVEYFKEAQAKAGQGEELSLSQLKMLKLPHPCQVYFLAPLWLPLVQVENLYIFPGVPYLFEKLLLGHSHLFVGGKFHRQIMFTDYPETFIAKHLSLIQSQMPQVSIGSYPQAPGNSFNVMVTIEGECLETVTAAADKLMPLIYARLSP